MMRVVYCLAMIAASTVMGAGDAAQARTYAFDSYFETKSIEFSTAPVLDAGNAFRLDGLLPDRGGSAVDQSFSFVAGSTDLSVSAGWRVAPPEVRTIGVNIDLLDSTDTVIASDDFSGVVAGLAQSTFTASGLVPGATYTVLLTGTAQGAGGRYQIDLVDGITPPLIPPTPVLATNTERSKFDSLFGTKGINSPLGGAPLESLDPGDTFRIDGLFAESGSIDNDAVISITGDTLSLGAVWRVLPDFQRTIGVNIDLLDSSNTVVSSDSFTGVTNGQAFSNFVATGLTPGDYTLRFTGLAQSGGRYRLELGTGLEAYAFDPTRSNVPEPTTWAMLIVGFAGTGLAIRRRRLVHAR